MHIIIYSISLRFKYAVEIGTVEWDSADVSKWKLESEKAIKK